MHDFGSVVIVQKAVLPPHWAMGAENKYTKLFSCFTVGAKWTWKTAVMELGMSQTQ
jgi:hypothetical protein